MTTWKFSNFNRSVLEEDLDAVATELTIAAEDAAQLPTLSSTEEKFPLTIWDGQNDPEIVYVTDNPGTGVLTVERGQEGSNQAAWPAGSEVRLALTAAILAEAVTSGGEIQTDFDALQAEFDALSYEVITYTDNHTLVLTDAGKILEMNSGSAKGFTIPPAADVAFPVNTRIDLVRFGSGAVQIIPGAGVTMRSVAGNDKITSQYAGASLYKRGTNEWVLLGNLTS